MTALTDLEEGVARVAAAVGPAVVSIGRHGGRGAGLVVADGAVVTNAHNLRGGQVTVTFADGRSLVGDVKGVDPEGDLAVVAVDTGGARPMPWKAGSGQPALGQVVYALGALPAGGGPRITFGTICSLGAAFRGPRGRLITDAFEHTAVIGRGSSGGPVVDRDGNLVGVNTHRPGDGLYLAIPATESLRSRVEALTRGESPVRRRLGVALTPTHVAERLRAAVGLPPRPGVLVRDVGEDTPAAAAGVQRGDLIVAAGGTPIDSIDGLLAAVDALGADGRLTLTVVRGTEELELQISFEG